MLRVEEKINNCIKEIQVYEMSISDNKKLVAVNVAVIGENFEQYNDLEKRYANLHEFLEVTFGWRKSQRNDYLKVGKFLRRENNFARFNEYNFTQLVEIAGVKAKDLEKVLAKITPDMSAKTIREVKNDIKNDGKSTETVAAKKATKADIKNALAEMLSCDDITVIKNKIKNLMADL
jgi:hypothetical protein